MRNRTDIIGSLLLIAIGVGVVIESFRLKLGTPLTPQPGFFPFIGGSLLIGLSIVLLVQGWLRRGESTRKPREVAGGLRKPAPFRIWAMSCRRSSLLQPFFGSWG
jgi:hypothetical protein